MKKLITLCIISLIIFNVKLCSQTTYTELCYDQPIPLLSGFDAPTQNEFVAWLDLQVLNEAGALVYQSIGGPWFNSPICGGVPLALNNIGLTGAQSMDKTLSLSLTDLLKNSTVTKVDGAKYQILVHAMSPGHCWHRYFFFKYTFRLATPGTIGNTGDYVCFNANYSVQNITQASNEPNNTSNYSWYYSNNSQILGQTGATLDITKITTPVSVYRKVSNTGLCPDKTSNTITIYPYNPFSGGVIGNDQAICNGATPNTLSSTTSPSGGSGNYSYRWFYNNSGSWQSWTGANKESYSPTSLVISTDYYREVDDVCGSSNSNTVSITVFQPLAEGAIPSPQPTVAYNTIPATLTCSAPSGGTGSYSYQWQVYNNAAYVDIQGATLASYTPPALTTSTIYRRSVTSGNCGTAYSNAVTINVYGQFSPGTIGISQYICNGGTPSQLVGSEPTGGTGTYTYQWQSSLDGSNFSNVLNATNSSFNPSALNTTTYFRRAATSGSCGNVYTNAIPIYVYSPLTEGTLTAPQTVCYGGDANPLQVSIPQVEQVVIHINGSLVLICIPGRIYLGKQVQAINLKGSSTQPIIAGFSHLGTVDQ
jgi:hypothetical protein